VERQSTLVVAPRGGNLRMRRTLVEIVDAATNLLKPKLCAIPDSKQSIKQATVAQKEET
jgi:hypothetical protein